jgi:hypothetical protein
MSFSRLFNLITSIRGQCIIRIFILLQHIHTFITNIILTLMLLFIIATHIFSKFGLMRFMGFLNDVGSYILSFTKIVLFQL